MEHWTEYTRLFTALVVIVDPFIAIPILLSLTHNQTIIERNKIVRVTAFTVAMVLLISAFIGETLLVWMGTSLASFRVGGGIVLFLMSLAMLQAEVGSVYPIHLKMHDSELSEPFKTRRRPQGMASPLLRSSTPYWMAR